MNDKYVGGFLDNIGGFYVLYNKTRQSVVPKFKLVCSKDNPEKNKLILQIIDYLKTKHNIIIASYDSGNNYIYQTCRISSVERLINFIEKNCKLKKFNQDYTKTVISKKKELEHKTKENKIKVYQKLRDEKQK